MGVRSLAKPETRLERALALGQRLKEGQAISGLAAAAMWGMRVPKSTEKKSPDAEVLTRVSDSRVRIDGVASRCIRDDLFKRDFIDGVPVVSPVLAVLTSAWHLEQADITVMLDALLSSSDSYPGLRFNRDPHLKPNQFPAMFEKFKRMRGIGKMRDAAVLARPGVESPMESILRLKLIEEGLPEPSIQPVVVLPNGETYRPDLGYEDLGVYFNYDGEVHFTDQATIDRDVLRDRHFQDQKMQLIHVVKTDLNGSRWRDLVLLVRRKLLGA
ncbi:hypothetical protein C7K25_15655 [Gulosibacter molinativorax]|uniref:DUF559 domain-containing protein n=1 Tax=Gulosibacter molinativorax TaxID=256821 RepID=A0ABT7CC52_9MICO|nr:hypothetical protein [Gulosibacter molinativorax]